MTRHRWVLWGALVLASLLIAGLAGWLWTKRPRTDEARKAAVERIIRNAVDVRPGI